jgi:hypothetical protein
MFQVKAKVQYYRDTCKAWLDRSFGDYYYSLIPKYKCASPQKYPAHVTIVRNKATDIVTDRTYWGYRDGDLIDIQYDGVIQYGPVYFWIDAYSDEIADIRMKLGLPIYRGDFTAYHITVGNKK